jgi:hypothetical protein
VQRPGCQLVHRQAEAAARPEQREVDLHAAGRSRELGEDRAVGQPADEGVERLAVEPVGHPEADDRDRARPRQLGAANGGRAVLAPAGVAQDVPAQARVRLREHEVRG